MKTYREIDWAAHEETWERWWAGTLGRPILQITVLGQNRDTYTHSFVTDYPRHTPAAEIIQAMRRQLEPQRYMADGYPFLWMNYGPGVLAALSGGEGHPARGTVWFSPGKFAGKPLTEIVPQFSPESDWSRWLADCVRAATREFGGAVKIGMTDLGGTLDVLASLRGTENLLMDLYDDPENVTRALDAETAAWLDAYSYYAGIISGNTSGTTCWGGFYASGKTYMLQSDFSYMISTEMYGQFVIPQLKKLCRFLDRPFYHLDGSKQIPHLELLAQVPNLRGIQWVPGDGPNPNQSEWPELLRHIEELGFRLQLYGTPEVVRKSLESLRAPSRAQVLLNVTPDHVSEAEKLVADYS